MTLHETGWRNHGADLMLRAYESGQPARLTAVITDLARTPLTAEAASSLGGAVQAGVALVSAALVHGAVQLDGAGAHLFKNGATEFQNAVNDAALRRDWVAYSQHMGRLTAVLAAIQKIGVKFSRTAPKASEEPKPIDVRVVGFDAELRRRRSR